MARGEGTQSKIHYKGKEDDFIVFAESAEDVKNWKKDHSIPLAQVVNSFKIFVTHKWVIRLRIHTSACFASHSVVLKANVCMMFAGTELKAD